MVILWTRRKLVDRYKKDNIDANLDILFYKRLSVYLDNLLFYSIIKKHKDKRIKDTYKTFKKQ